MGIRSTRQAITLTPNLCRHRRYEMVFAHNPLYLNGQAVSRLICAWIYLLCFAPFGASLSGGRCQARSTRLAYRLAARQLCR